MPDTLPPGLRQARELLLPVRRRSAAAERAIQLLERDLLPRTAGGDVALVTGIVGPNNAGKSALFNALVDRILSPSVASGGATRRLVGAAHPHLLARLEAEPTLARFRLRRFTGASGEPMDATQPASDPAEVLVAAEDQLPPNLMLIDTPDFDSILAENRMASESLLNVADLVIAVVTRHSYQNREVVQFLQRWLDHRRPWMLVYNEAIDDTVTRAHASKLASDVGTAPIALFAAAHSLDVQAQRQPLVVHEIDLEEQPGSSTAGSRRGRTLRDLLFDLRAVGEIKRCAFHAALARLRDDLAEVGADLKAGAAQAHALLDVAEERGFEAGVRIAAAAMPGGPFIEAFRAVLDRRSNPLSRSWRAALRQVRLRIESLPGLLRGRGSEPEVSLATFERQALQAIWPVLWEQLVRDLGAEARHPARRSVPAALAESLDRDLSGHLGNEARARVEHEMAARPPDLDTFRQECEALVENAIEERGFDLDIQAAADLATLLPLAFAAAVIVKTAGLGSDLAAAGGGALSTFLFEKYAHLLGRGILNDVRRHWTVLRGRQLARLLTDAALANTAPLLRGSVEEDSTRAEELAGLGRLLQ